MPKKNNGIHIHYRKDRQYFEIREFISGKRKRHATGLGSREVAEERLAEVIVAKRSPEKYKTDMKIGDVIAYYVREHIPSITRPDVALANIERLIPFWGELELSEIRKSLTYKYYEYRKKETHLWQKTHGRAIKELSQASVRRELEQLQAAINYAYRENLVLIKPHVYKYEKSAPRDRWMTRQEVAMLLWESRRTEQVRDYLPLFILLGVYTGQRKTAILKLRWSDVDFKRGIIDFTKNDRSKKKKSARVRIHRKLMIHLKYARRRGIETGYVLHRNQNPISDPKKAYNAACERAGIDGVTIHTMRHTCASWLMQANVSSNKIAEHLGHTSPRMIEATYGHLSTEHMDEVMDVYG